MIPIMDTYRFTRDEVASVLPAEVGAWIRFADYKEKMGEIEDAGYYRSRALDFLDAGKEIKPAWFNQLIAYYNRQKEYDKALGVLRQAVEKVPDHAPFHVMLGDYYQREGITYRAREEYERAVLLEPGNETYRRKLHKLELDIEFGKK